MRYHWHSNTTFSLKPHPSGHEKTEDHAAENGWDLLDLNRNPRKGCITITKILQNNRNFDMKQLFEWGDFKALPVVIGWFDKAAGCVGDYREGVQRATFSAIYQFARNVRRISFAPRVEGGQ